jgi:hypothetical protein
VERKFKSIFLLIGARFLALRRPRLVNYGVKIGEANLLEKSVKRPALVGAFTHHLNSTAFPSF